VVQELAFRRSVRVPGEGLDGIDLQSLRETSDGELQTDSEAVGAFIEQTLAASSQATGRHFSKTGLSVLYVGEGISGSAAGRPALWS
jgi:hypothetical protein